MGVDTFETVGDNQARPTLVLCELVDFVYSVLWVVPKLAQPRVLVELAKAGLQ